jgi:hypothetical protein
MHVHLVFVAKYRRHVFDGPALDRLRDIFTAVCRDFDAQLVEMDGEDDHVHLLVEYPPRVPVSALVNSLEGRLESTPAPRPPGSAPILARRPLESQLLRRVLLEAKKAGQLVVSATDLAAGLLSPSFASTSS